MDASAVTDYRSVIGYFSQVIMKELRLVTGYDVLHGKVKTFISDYLFTTYVNIDDINTIRNLSELDATKTIIETFKKKINELIIDDKGSAKICDTIKLKNTPPFVVKEQGYLMAQKSIFNKIVGDSSLELSFASFLEGCPDIISYAKNYFAVKFNIDYVKADGNISKYYPDFFVKMTPTKIYIVETKGLEDLDVPLKMDRLKTWCADINSLQNSFQFDYIFVDEASFEKYKPKTFGELVAGFEGYKETGTPNE